MNRRDFLFNAFKVGALASLGLSLRQRRAVADGWFYASGASCTDYSKNSNNDTTKVMHSQNSQRYFGFIFDDASSGKICGVRFYMHSVIGDVTGKDYYAEIWNIGASDALSSLVTNGRSSKIVGAAWSAQFVFFDFPTPADYDCTGTNQYGIVVKAIADDAAADTVGAYDSTNYARTRTHNAENTWSYNMAVAEWASNGSLTAKYTTYMPVMGIWRMA